MLFGNRSAGPLAACDLYIRAVVVSEQIGRDTHIVEISDCSLLAQAGLIRFPAEATDRQRLPFGVPDVVRPAIEPVLLLLFR